jgi:hypothetical protein
MTPRQQTLLEYLNEHVHYELLMLRYSLLRMAAPNDQLDFNANFVSFGVHARNLYKFLRNDEGNSKAKDYAPMFKTEGNLPPLRRWEEAIFHMGKSRPATAEDGKLVVSDAVVFANWTEDNFGRFIAEADEPYRSKWRSPILGRPTLPAWPNPGANSRPKCSSVGEYLFSRWAQTHAPQFFKKPKDEEG